MAKYYFTKLQLVFLYFYNMDYKYWLKELEGINDNAI